MLPTFGAGRRARGAHFEPLFEAAPPATRTRRRRGRGGQLIEVQVSPDDPIKSARADASVWVLLSRSPGLVSSFGAGVPIDFAEAGRNPVVWTDDFSNILELVTFFHQQ